MTSKDTSIVSLEGYRLSPVQERLWRLHTLSGPYHAHGLMRITGALDPDALARELAALVGAHEMLRAIFRTVPGTGPVQVIASAAEVEDAGVDWSRLDVRELPREEREQRARRHFDEACARGFDLASGPLLRATLATLDAREHLVGLIAPALCADAVAMERLCMELAGRHVHRQADQPRDRAGEESASYLSFAEWQRQLLEDGAEAAPAELWRGDDLAAHAGLSLPLAGKTGTTAGAQQAFRPARCRLDVEFGADGPGSLEDVVMATWVALLWQHTRRDELILGLLSHGREHPELEATVGLLARWVPVRSRLGANTRLCDLAQELGEARREVLEWQRYFLWPIEGDDLTAGRDFPSIGFSWSAGDDASSGDEAVRIERAGAYVDRFELYLSCVYERGRLALELHHDSTLYSPAAAEHLLAQLAALLDQVARDATRTLADLDPGSDAERARLLRAFDTTAFDTTDHAAAPGCVLDWIEDQAARHPERTAVVFEDRSITYAELDARANQIAHGLRSRGAGPEVRVGLCTTRSLEMIVGMLGIMKAGAAYAPLDPTQPERRLLYLMDDIDAPVVLTEERLAGSIPDREGSRVLCLDDEAVFADQPTQPPARQVAPEHAVYVLFTSGSTGRPKGVVVEHRQLHNYVASVLHLLELPGSATYATVSTFAADLGNTVIFPALCTGSCLHVISAERASDPIALAEYAARHPIDCLKIVPSHLRALMSAGNEQRLMPRQRLILGGEATPTEWAARLRSLVPACKIYNHYGPTETTVGVLTYGFEPEKRDIDAAHLPLERPVDNTRVYVLDERLRPVPVGVDGEIYIGGAAVTRGYLNRPGLTARAFVPDPFSPAPGARMYRTGDRARHRPDGTIEFAGRADDQVKYHGYRLELAELRHAINQHPRVRDSVVLLRRDKSGAEALIAYYVSRQEIDAEELRGFLSEHVIDEVLPNIYVHLRKLPLTLNGKIHYDALPSVDEARQRRRRSSVPPRTAEEQTLAAIWSEVLDIQGIGVHDNFFSLGGDSILGILVISRSNEAGLRLSPRQLFQYQTIAELARVATRVEPGASNEEPDQGPVDGPVALLPIHRWFFAQDMPDPDACAVVVPLEARQPVDVALLEQALTALLHHHDALRLRFARQGQEQTQEDETDDWHASIAPAGDAMPLRRLDLSAVPDAELAETIRTHERELQAQLRLQDGPVVVAAWFDLGPARPARLVIVAHRLVIDGVSWRILFEHLHTAYQQLASSGSCRLPARTTSIQSWAERLREYADSPELREELAYWTRGPWDQVRPLPTDRSVAPSVNPPGADQPRVLDHTVVSTLGEDPSRALLYDLPELHRCDVGELLIAALVVSLCAWSGQPSLLLDIEGHGREDLFEGIDLSRTVGWFTSLHPVLLSPAADCEAHATLKAVKESLRAVPRRGLGYGVLRYLCTDDEVARRLDACPRAEALFRYVGRYNQLQSSWLSVLDHPEQQAPTRRHKLAVIAGMVEDRLHLTWYFSAALYDLATIEALSRRYVQVLEGLVAERDAPRRSALTPSDFPLAGLDQAKLDKLISRLEK